MKRRYERRPFAAKRDICAAKIRDCVDACPGCELRLEEIENAVLEGEEDYQLG